MNVSTLIHSSFSIRAAFLAALVVLFLLIFRPFSLVIDTFWHLYTYLGLGLVIFSLLHINHYLVYPMISSMNWINEKNRRIVAGLYVAILSLVVIYAYFASFSTLDSNLDVALLIKIVLVSLVPILSAHYFTKTQNLQQQIMELQSSSISDDDEILIQLTSENGKETLQLHQQDIFYIRADDNYVTIAHHHEKELKEVLLRATLSSLEKMLEQKGIIRCHRSYLVNLTNIQRLYRQAGRQVIELSGGKNTIPVSRSYLARVRELLSPPITKI